MERVKFRADNENQRSINAMKSIGCVVEGVLRSNTYKPNGELRDSIVLSILKDEWNNTVKQKLKENASHSHGFGKSGGSVLRRTVLWVYKL
jgi:hypothetical protein